MVILPYRSKNPPEQYPYATIGLIAVNVLVYLFTTNFFLVIKDGDVADYALSPSTLGPMRLLTSMFLHEDPFHIGGNMLFLWIFGIAVEGRLGIPKYLLLYFVSGLAAGLLQCFSEVAMNSDVMCLGASGAIMGLAGAYLYVFPFARIMVFRFFWFFIWISVGSWEWLAWWVVALYMGLNVFNAIISVSLQITGGTAFFEHIGGFCAGFLMVVALRARRDSAQLSEVQAVRADAGNDLSILNASELEQLLHAPTDNMNIVLSYCNKVIVQQGDQGLQKAIQMIDRYKQQLLSEDDTERICDILLRFPPTMRGLPGPFYLRLGGKLEQQRKFEIAAHIYRRVYDLYGSSPDAGAALMRLGRIWEQSFNRPDLSKEAYAMYLEHFSTGPLVEDAEKSLARVNLKINGVSRTAKTQAATVKEYQFPLTDGERVIDVSDRPQLDAPDLEPTQKTVTGPKKVESTE